MSFLETEGADVWVDDELEKGIFRDPLSGDRSEIEKYLESPHRFPGVPVKFGPLSIGLNINNGTTQLSYCFINGVVVQAEITGSARRIEYKRAFEVGSTPKIETRLTKSEIKKSAAVSVIPSTNLQQNLQRTAALKRRVQNQLKG